LTDIYDLDLSIIILNWNTAMLLDGCLASIIKNTKELMYEIFIVDNNSKGDEFDNVIAKYKDHTNFHWIKNKDNIGGIADNIVLPLCRGRYIALIGNDTVIFPECLKKIINFMDKHPDAGAVSARLLNPDGTVQPYYARFHDLPMYFWRGTIIGSAIDRVFFQGKYAKHYWYSDLDAEKLNVVDQPPGACLVLRRGEFIKEYIIDEKLPFFFNDVDLCRRIYLAGYKIYVLPDADIIHYSGSSFKKADPKWVEVEYRKSLLYYFRKYYPCQLIVIRLLLFIDSLIQSIYGCFYNRTINLIRKELAGCDSILDLGCGYNSPIQYLNVKYSLGVDMYEPYITESKQKSLHSEYLLADIRKVDFPECSFDAVILLEVLEHLNKDEGLKLIENMRKWAKKKVIITVPNGFVWQDGYDNNEFQIHRAKWTVKELRKMNFKVYGLGGIKYLHGYKGNIKYKPRILWKALSFFSIPLLFYVPEMAFLLGAIGNKQ